FGEFSKQAQLDLAYAYYKTEESASAIAACDRFIKFYPTSSNVDYAYYLKGLANFNQGKGLAQRYLPNDPSQRDPGASLQAFRDFTELTKRFPNSRYLRDARKRMMYLRNILAQHEVNVANFYLWREAYLAAANRALYVVENYQQAPAMPDALTLLVRSYKALQLEDLAADAMRVLERNYPDHPGVADVKKLVDK
ncbi:MAG: outer membrane protein assembly factor BamD, partial [Gammaproteobacteria bacterium]